MISKGIFKRPKNKLENYDPAKTAPSVPDAMCVECPVCKIRLLPEDLHENAGVCPKCNHYFRINARQRLRLVCGDTFREYDADMIPSNLIDFPDYDKKLQNAMLESGEKESVITGEAEIDGSPCCVFAMEPRFMMGSMGSVTGEKITRIFEYAAQNRLPVVGFTVSGGARMQEGILSLMQMAKVSGAVKRHSDAGCLYTVVLTDPTTGGVTASFAMQADIILAEPGALIGFAGPRLIEQSIRQKLPQGFQRAEFLLEHGFIDQIVERKKLRIYLSRILALHRTEACK